MKSADLMNGCDPLERHQPKLTVPRYQMQHLRPKQLH